MPVLDRIAFESAWKGRGTGGKALLGFGLLGAAAFGPAPLTAPLVLATTLALALFSARLPARLYLRLLAIPLGFLLTSLPVFLLSVGWDHGPTVTLNETGWRQALPPTLRSLAAVAALLLLTLTTPVSRLLVLGHRLGLPTTVTDLALLTHRLLFVIADMAVTGARSQAFRLGYRGWRRSLRSVSLLAAGLLGRSLDRSRRLETGLAARGFRGELPILVQIPATTPGEWTTAVAIPLALLLLAWSVP
ncbi:MAG: cobalt ECF transporter T component CbiQ [Magnetococcales bacterium]|nr:cobalt ECF transporter T component CbiQ [Magnetococcales bacterium]MBF0157054.1 cobalt ECF transporter T component CbiQ [Magnetococcales bacterium]